VSAFGAHYGLKSDIAPVRKVAMSGHGEASGIKEKVAEG
jgi:hypothetical protein